MENLVANSQATIVDITVENFQQIIVEASQEKLVLIDFGLTGVSRAKI